MITFLVILLCYLAGSFPTAFLVGRWKKKSDIRQMGDGNMGAQNVFREVNHAAGVVVGVVDAGKGALVILIARGAGLPLQSVLVAGAAAVAGHNWPVWLRFRGGRGLATAIGVLMMLNTGPMLIAAMPAIFALVIFKSIPVTGIVLFVTLLFTSWWLRVPGLLITYGIILPVVVGLTHWYTVSRSAARLKATGSPYAR